jgi:sugar O-acyltransferase (sialic acid O-acetyltransferase NeuD family)
LGGGLLLVTHREQEYAVDVVIYGAGGFGREVLWILRSMAACDCGLRIAGFIDDNSKLQGMTVCDLRVLGGLEYLCCEVTPRIVLGVGEPNVKRAIVDKMKALNLRLIQAVHPSCEMSQYVELREGAVIAGGSILTTQVTVGRWATVNLNCTIGHDVDIGDYATLAPGVHISGGVILGEGVKIGTGAVVLPGVRIGPWSVIGAGAVVTKDLPGGIIAVGVPAKVIKENT